MKMKKIKIAAVLLAVSMTPTNALAATPQMYMDNYKELISLTPRWSETGWIFADIGAEGTTLLLNVSVTVMEDNATVTGTIYLEKNVNGKWRNVKSWRLSGKGDTDISKTYRGVAGTEYRVRVNAKVGAEQITETSGTYEL